MGMEGELKCATGRKEAGTRGRGGDPRPQASGEAPVQDVSLIGHREGPGRTKRSEQINALERKLLASCSPRGHRVGHE